MHCHECGTGNTLDSKYCKECGAKINDGYRTMMLSVQDIESLQSADEQGRLAKFLDMAFWHNEAGNIDAAIRASESALAINPKSTTAHSLLGTLYEKKGEDVQAIQHFETVLTLNPDSAADAAKLAQIRSGVHVRAMPAPAAQRWLPPAVVALGPVLKDKWGTLLSSDQEQPLALKRKPLYAAGAAGAAVLIIGLLLLRPASSVQSASKAPVTTPPLTQSAFAPRAAPSGDATTTTTAAPFVLPPGVGGGVPLSSAFSAPNPFRGTPSTRAALAAPSLPEYDLPPTRARNRRRSVRRGDSSSLPPLTLNALPLPNQDQIAPAPVSVPATATVAAIPQHTVVVSSLPGSPPPSANASYNSGWNNGPAPVAPHIHISLSESKLSGDSSPAAGDSSSGEGESLQQSALSLQQQGEYRSALADYSRAIRAYKSQIAAGHDVEAAQRGLQVCQTGLRICQQSQP